MKTRWILCSLMIARIPLNAQEVVEERVVETLPGGVVQETVTRTEVGDARKLDRALARRQLGLAPRAIPVEQAPAPGTTVETTTTVVETPGLPPRVYNTERHVVVVEGRELAYVTLPVLFVKETAELLDTESRLAIEETAAAIREILQTSPAARFEIEGHTSTEGEEAYNLDLSGKRAKRVYDELTMRYKVPAAVLSARGFGESYAKYPEGTEAQRVLDRRVLVVRLQ